MFFFSRKDRHVSPLSAVVDAAIPEADRNTQLMVAAVAGLIGSIAFADRQFSHTEQQRVLSVLQGVEGVDENEAQAILQQMRSQLLRLTSTDLPRHARTLKELGEPHQCRQVLRLLMQVAGADNALAQAETAMLQQVCTALGLTRHDYEAALSEHQCCTPTR